MKQANGGVNSLESSQDVEFFKRSWSGESFAPKMSIQMIKMIGAHVEESCFERTTSICPGVFGFPDAEIWNQLLPRVTHLRAFSAAEDV